MDADIQKINEKSEKSLGKINAVRQELEKVIVGQEEIIDRLLMGVLCDSHILLEGMPGLAKTLMVHTLANITSCSFKRIQFTPDLLPADIVGTKIYSQKNMEFQTSRGPIFSNFILADEINRAPPKVQSALLEAMQERQVTISGDTLLLEKPFFVLATQNPIEVEGTYPLPEAQVDRFMFKVLVDYPGKEEEVRIMKRMAEGEMPETNVVLEPKDIMILQKTTDGIYVDEKIEDYIADIVIATRKPGEYGLQELEKYVMYGASPRASIYLVKSSKANALLQGRGYVTPDDVKEVAQDVLRHRLIPTYEAEAEEKKTGEFIDEILGKIASP